MIIGTGDYSPTSWVPIANAWHHRACRELLEVIADRKPRRFIGNIHMHCRPDTWVVVERAKGQTQIGRMPAKAREDWRAAGPAKASMSAG
jgi:hypothetical protein